MAKIASTPSYKVKQKPTWKYTMPENPDKYDRAIDSLQSTVGGIATAYFQYDKVPAGCLFQFVTPDGLFHENTENPDQPYGCLSSIRLMKREIAWTPELTRRIRADERIPKEVHLIQPHHLPVFAEWQRIIDQEIRNAK